MSEPGKEILKLTWRPEPDGEALDLQTVQHYRTPAQWQDAFVLMARGVAALFAREGADDEEKDFQAGVLLRMSAMSMKIDPFVVEALGVSEAAKHPGSVPIPQDVWDNHDSREILSIWLAPDPERREAGLPEPFYLSGETETVPHEQMGDLLAQVAIRYVLFACEGDDSKQKKMLSRIQKDFMMRFDLGMTKQ